MLFSVSVQQLRYGRDILHCYKTVCLIRYSSTILSVVTSSEVWKASSNDHKQVTVKPYEVRFTFEFASFVLCVILLVCEWLCHTSFPLLHVCVVTNTFCEWLCHTSFPLLTCMSVDKYIGLWVTVSHFLSIVTCMSGDEYIGLWVTVSHFLSIVNVYECWQIHWFVSECVTLPFHCYNVYVVTIYIDLWVSVSHFLSIVTMYAWWRIQWFASDCVTLSIVTMYAWLLNTLVCEWRQKGR